MQGTPDIAQLRNLLFGKDYEALLALKAQFEDSEQYSARIASVIAEAITRREAHDGAISTALMPTVERSLTHAISSNPKRFADVLYPVMGPAIRKSIQQALNEALTTFNQLLEQSLSLRSWHWRFDAWRTGQSYAQIALLNTLIYQVEQVFLIHRESGLLLNHLVSEHVHSKDPEIISSMLTAIQDFINDSFATEGDGDLDTLQLGKLTVLIEHAPHAVLALVVRGSVPGELRHLLAETCETIHQQYDHALQTYQGDASPFTGIESLLNDCLVKKHKTKEKCHPWLAYTLLLTLLGALAWWVYQYEQHQAHLIQQAAEVEQAQQIALQTLTQQLQQQQSQQAALQVSLQTLLDQQQQQTAQQAKQAADNAATIAALSQQIEAASHTFDKAQTDIDPKHPGIVTLSKDILALLHAAQQANKTLQVIILGHADGSGSVTLNQQMSQQRADNLRNVLIQAGIPAFVLAAHSSNQKNERSTNCRVSLY